MAKSRIMQTMLYDSAAILVFCCQRSWRNFVGLTPCGERNTGGVVGSNSDFQPISRYVSEAVQDRDIATMEG